MRYPKWPMLRRLLLEFWYLCFLAYELPRYKSSTAAVITVVPPVLYLPFSRRILRKGVPIVGIVHDLQSIFLEKSSSLPMRALAALIRRMEGAALRNCDSLIFLSQSMASRAIEQYGLDGTNCFVHLPFVSRPSIGGNGQELVEIFTPNCRACVYAGALGEKQNSERLVECFVALVKAESGIVCHCFSRGPMFNHLRRKYENIFGIKFHDLVDERDLPELLARSDIQVVPQLFGTSEAALPSKLPNLIAAGVPVLAICDEVSEVGRIVLKARAGSVVHSWDPDAISAAALNLLNATKGQSREERKATASAFVAQHFSLQRLVDEISGFIKQTPG